MCAFRIQVGHRDQLVGGGEQRLRNCQAEHFGGRHSAVGRLNRRLIAERALRFVVPHRLLRRAGGGAPSGEVLAATMAPGGS
jgi:hypothetical protein